MSTSSARSSSTTSSIVPSTEPSATTTVSAPRRPGTSARRPPEPRPNSCSNSPAIRGTRSSACICFACMRYLTSVNASGPTIAPIVTGSSGSSTCRGSKAGRNAST